MRDLPNYYGSEGLVSVLKTTTRVALRSLIRVFEEISDLIKEEGRVATDGLRELSVSLVR